MCIIVAHGHGGERGGARGWVAHGLLSDERSHSRARTIAAHVHETRDVTRAMTRARAPALRGERPSIAYRIYGLPDAAAMDRTLRIEDLIDARRHRHVTPTLCDQRVA